MFNKVVLVGNLTRDIELRYSSSGSAIASTAIATSRKFTQNGERREETCFIDITFFGRSAEVANMYLKRGSKILVEGRLNFDQWVAQDGSKRSKHSVIVETMQMMDTRSETGAHNSQSQSQSQEYGGANVDPRSMQQKADERQEQNHTAYQQPQNYNHAQQQDSMPNHLPGIDIDEDDSSYIPF